MPRLIESLYPHLDALARHAGAPSTLIGVAVSGGSDSIALLHLVAHWAAARDRTLCVFTVDHRLRVAAHAEAQTVAALAGRLGHAHQTLIWQAPNPQQAAARRARHGLLASALRASGGRLMLMAHTLDDQLETVAMRRAHSSSPYGEAGMRRLAPSPVWPEGDGVMIGRPLLETPRRTLRDWLTQLGESWIDDPSNQDTDYERVRWRARLADDAGFRADIAALLAARQLSRDTDDTALLTALIERVRVADAGVTVAFHGLRPLHAARLLIWLIRAIADTDTTARWSAAMRLATRIGTPNFAGATLGRVRFQPNTGRDRVAAKVATGFAQQPGQFKKLDPRPDPIGSQQGLVRLSREDGAAPDLQALNRRLDSLKEMLQANAMTLASH